MSLHLLRLVLNSMPVAVASFDRDLKLLGFNRAWQDFREEFTDVSFASLGFEHSLLELSGFPGVAELVPSCTRALGGETIQSQSVRRESEAGNQARRWDLICSPLSDEGRIVGLTSIAIDVTARDLAERNRRREADQRRRVAESLRDTLAMLNSSYTLQSLLGTIVEQGKMTVPLDRGVVENAVRWWCPTPWPRCRPIWRMTRKGAPSSSGRSCVFAVCLAYR